MIRLETLNGDEALRLRAIRLRALGDAPDAFGTTLEEASAWPLERWSEQLGILPTFVAVRDLRDVGVVRGSIDDVRKKTGWLISMWVAPEARRAGVGGLLVDVVVNWARARGLDRLLLDVADHNAAAIALYARKGFLPTGEVGSLPPPRGHILEHRRVLKLR